MLRRLFLVFLPSFIASVSHANDASWNCEQNKDSKEWVCVGEKKKVATSESTTLIKPENNKASSAEAMIVEERLPIKISEIEPLKSDISEPSTIANSITEPQS